MVMAKGAITNNPCRKYCRNLADVPLKSFMMQLFYVLKGVKMAPFTLRKCNKYYATGKISTAEG
jgi:hypothetical protein